VQERKAAVRDHRGDLMAIEHSTCDACEQPFVDRKERTYPEKCPMCGAIQGRHALGFWGYLVVLVVVAIILWGRYSVGRETSDLRTKPVSLSPSRLAGLP
jgi:hypothetical protein